MYENLIETLRFCAKNGDCHDCPYEKPCAGTMGDGLYCEAADAIEELSKPRWISVEERLPEQGRQYIVCRKAPNGETIIETLWHDGKKLWWNRLYTPLGKITHWMPLPTPPKEETE